MTRTVLPPSTSRWRTSSSFSTSAKSSPVRQLVEGRSASAVARRDSSVASLTRCASPPDSVVAAAQVDVAQPDVVERLELDPDVRHRREELDRLGDLRHLEDVGDRAALEVRSRAPPGCSACPCRPGASRRRRQELHLDLQDHHSPLQFSQRPALTLNGAARRVTDARLRGRRRRAPDRPEQTVYVAGFATASGRSALVDLDDLVDVLGADSLSWAPTGSTTRSALAQAGPARR